jgi:hypothetical protein
MGELIGDEGTTENLQAPAIGGRVQRAVIDGPDELGANEHAEIQRQSREPPYAPENPIGPVGSLQRHPVILHEGPQQRRMPPFFPNQQVDDADQMRHLVGPREVLRGSQERPPIGLLAELKRCDGARDELSFLWPQNIGQTVGYPARTQSVMLEVIQPDLQISGTHRHPPDCTHRECGSPLGYSREAIRADCGGGASGSFYSAERLQGRSRLTDKPPLSRLAS